MTTVEPCLWIRNLKATLENRPVLLLHGNVRDRYIDENGRVFDNLTALLSELSRALPGSFSEHVFYDSVDGERRVSQKAERQPVTPPSPAPAGELGGPPPEPRSGTKPPPERVLATWARQLNGRDQNRLMVVYYLDKLVAFRPAGYSDQEKEVLLWLEKAIENITDNNRLVLVALQDTMIPVELYTNSPKSTVFGVPLPNKSDRMRYFKHRIAPTSGEAGQEHYKALLEQLTGLTDGLFLRDIDPIAAAISGTPKPIGTRDVSRLVNKYRLGEQEDYWSQLGIQKLDTAKKWFVDQHGVKGQDEAISKVIEKLCLARAGLSGMASGTASKPRGVLFFAGPTGVGKTLVAKKLAVFLFGTENAFLPFDMSEFKEEHTVSKLIGSPPGYVGYERGGLLTNSVRARPFSVILFDEIEKAHPKVMDIFLQILDEGRVTDSRGQTVFFTETMIIFTTNLGTRSTDSRNQPSEEKEQLDTILNKEGIGADAKKQQVRKHFIGAVERFFTVEISRPELLNRIGNNIVPFNFIDTSDVQKAIIQSHLKRICGEFEDKYRSARHQVSFEESVSTWAVAMYESKFKEFGARGITNALEDLIMVPLAKAVLLAEHENHLAISFRCLVNPGGGFLDIRQN